MAASKQQATGAKRHQAYNHAARRRGREMAASAAYDSRKQKMVAKHGINQLKAAAQQRNDHYKRGSIGNAGENISVVMYLAKTNLAWPSYLK